MKNRALFRNLWHYIAPNRRMQLTVLLVIMVFASFAEVVSIGAVLPFLGVLMSPERVFKNPVAQPMIDLMGYTKPEQLLLPLTGLFIVASLFSGVMRLALIWAEMRLSFAVGADLSSQIYKSTLYQPYSVHVSRNSSQVIAGISTKTNSVIERTLIPILRLLSSSIILVVTLTGLILINPAVSLLAFGGFGFIYGLIAFVTKNRLAYDSQRIGRETSNVIKALQEGLGGIRDVLIDGAQATYCKIYKEADLRLRRSQANVLIIGGGPRYIIEFLGMTLIAVISYKLAQGGGSSIASAIPVLGVLALGAQRMMPVLQQVYFSWSAIRAGDSCLRDVLELLDQPLPKFANEPLPEPLPFTQLIRLNQVGFRYADIAPWVLQGINLEIPKGSCIGFIGTTGSGKSTLIDLIMGLLTPTDGMLAVDGVPITPINNRAWQARIAHVPQNIFLADTTISENIAFGISPEKIDHVRVRHAARQAQIADTIESMSMQYETLVGERGIRLSGGQRQRLGIARALYKQTDVIVFDEATSALDGETELAVMESIESLSLNLTVLIVAHRLSTLRNCSQIIELGGGVVRRIMSYNEIISDANSLKSYVRNSNE